MSSPKYLIAVGASAGGLEPILALIKALPAKLDAAVIICTHRPDRPRSPDGFRALLQRHTRQTVRDICTGDPIETSTIYVPTPDSHLQITREGFQEYDGPRDRHWRPSINMIFESAAEAFREHTIGVILSGTMDDGVQGMRHIYHHGGMAFVQHPEEAQFAGMPNNSIFHDHPDMIAPVAQIIETVISAVQRDTVRKPTAYASARGVARTAS